MTTAPRKVEPKFTRIVADFFSDQGFEGEIGSTPNTDVPFRITGFTYSKQLGAAAGSWTLRVKSSDEEDLTQLWPDPEDVWVWIYGQNGTEQIPILLGLINSVRESMRRNSKGERSVGYSIHGSDFGKIFEKTVLHINPYELKGTLPTIPLYQALGDKITGSPSDMVRALVEAWLGNKGQADGQWKMPNSLGGQLFFRKLKLEFGSTRGKTFDPSIYDIDQTNGRNLWTTLQQYQNGLLNEMWPDLDPATGLDPALILRERPFPYQLQSGGGFHTREWDALPTKVLEPKDVTAREMAIGNPDARFNYWALQGEGLTGNGISTDAILIEASSNTGVDFGEPGTCPIFNTESIRRHGFRKWVQSTRYIPFREGKASPGSDGGAYWQEALQWLKLLHDWYVVAPRQLSGTIELTRLHPDIRVGSRVREERHGGGSVLYYVEGVQHLYSYPGTGETTLTVTRGEFE